MAMPATRKDRTDWTVDEVLELPNDGSRYELVDGVLLVSPAPSWPHQVAVSHLMFLLQTWLNAHPIGIAGVAPCDFIFSNCRLLQPDAWVLPFGPKVRRPAQRSPTPMLVVEITSPSTARHDRKVKRPVYQSEMIPEYWIVDLDAQVIERWRPDDVRTEVIINTLEWTPSPEHSAFVLELPAFFRTVQERVDATGIADIE